MKKQLLIILITLFAFVSCTKDHNVAQIAVKINKELTTVEKLKVNYKIDLIKIWEETNISPDVAGRLAAKGKKPQAQDAITVWFFDSTLTSINNGDGTITHTWVLPANPNFSFIQHSDNALSDGSIDLTVDAQGNWNSTGVFTFANYYQYSWFLAGQPYITSFVSPNYGGYYRFGATDLSQNVYISYTTHP